MDVNSGDSGGLTYNIIIEDTSLARACLAQ